MTTTVQPNNREMVRVVKLLDDRISNEVFAQTDYKKAYNAWSLIGFQIRSNVKLVPVDEMDLELTGNWLNTLSHFIHAAEMCFNGYMNREPEPRLSYFTGLEVLMEDAAREHRLFSARMLSLIHQEAEDCGRSISDAQRRVHKRLKQS